jgi:hypothetical protein
MATELIIATADLAVRVNGYQIKATNLLDQAKRAEINDMPSLANAQKFMGVVGAIKSNLEEERKVTIDDFDKRVRFINAQYKPVRDQLEEAYELVRSKASTFERIERKRLMEAQERAQKAADDEAVKSAESREQAGDAAGADAIIEMASQVHMPTAKVVLPRDEMTGTKLKVRRVWEGKVGDVKAMCAAIAAGHLPEDIVDFKKSRINEIAKGWAAARTDQKVLEIHKYGLIAEEVDSLTR